MTSGTTSGWVVARRFVFVASSGDISLWPPQLQKVGRKNTSKEWLRISVSLQTSEFMSGCWPGVEPSRNRPRSPYNRVLLCWMFIMWKSNCCTAGGKPPFYEHEIGSNVTRWRANRESPYPWHLGEAPQTLVNPPLFQTEIYTSPKFAGFSQLCSTTRGLLFFQDKTSNINNILNFFVVSNVRIHLDFWNGSLLPWTFLWYLFLVLVVGP